MRLNGYGVVEFFYDGNIIKAKCVSVIDETVSYVSLNMDQATRLNRWIAGEGLIQQMLPELSNDEREILMTGITPEQWDETFKEPENMFDNEEEN